VVLADDLITLGYGGPETRALQRFQRHAKRTYRKTAVGQCSEETPVYAGPEDGVAHPETLAEIARWLAAGFRLPLAYFPIVKVGQWGALRQDMAEAWLELAARIKELGGTIDGPYGDTKRPLMTAISTGASKFSFHVCGRALDLNQGGLNQGRKAYFVAREPRGEQMWWRIYCRTADQTGAQGRKFDAGSASFYGFAAHREYPLPAGYYLDLTAEIERAGLFEPIHAQQGWEQNSRKAEWWHFQWVPWKQATFQDECELIGITEAQLRASGYTDADLDHPPG
jgi:hypothetical protein